MSSATANSSSSTLEEQRQFLVGSPVSALSPLAQQLVNETYKLFVDNFGEAPKNELSAALAPGRVNLIGEHTDYNDGFVMPLAIDRHTVLIGKKNGLQKFRIVSANANTSNAAAASDAMDTGAAASAPSSSVSIVELDNDTMYRKYERSVWHNYFRGVVAQFAAAGHTIPFFDVAIKGNVPLGGGLSSSASLEVATASFLQSLIQLPLDGTQRALWCQKCEHDYCNVPCGVMDQFISSLAEKDHVMLLDCRSFVSCPITQRCIPWIRTKLNNVITLIWILLFSLVFYVHLCYRNLLLFHSLMQTWLC
jgi:galactokinase